MNEHKVDLLFYRYFVFYIEGVDENQNSAMKNVELRKAIAYAIDRESLLYDVYLDSGTLIESGVPTSYASYNGQEITYDPEMAISLLKEI